MATSQKRELEEPLSSAPAGTGRKLHAFAHFLGQNIVTWLLSRRKAHWEMQSSKGPRALPKVVLMPAEVGRKDTDDIEQFLLQLYLFFWGVGRGLALMPPPKLGSDPTVWFWENVFTPLSLCFLMWEVGS